MKLNTLKLAILTLAALPFSHSSAGIATYNRWDISEINVCFADKETQYRSESMQGSKRDWKQKEKTAVQKILEEEFTPARTGYSFVGFQDCANTEKINVVVGVRKGFSLQTISGELGLASVGKTSYNITSYSGAQGAVILSPTGINRVTITHEFGHILGLKHEHEHPDAQANSNSLCPYYKEDNQFYDSLIFTDFDETSVMNYCYMLSPKGWNAGLSVKDQELILDIHDQKYKYNPGHVYKPAGSFSR